MNTADILEKAADSNAYGPLTRRMFGEEMLGALHAIIAILLFKEGWTILAWVFVVRAAVDETAALTFALKARRREPDKATEAAALAREQQQ